MKWSVITKTFLTLSGLFRSIVVSMLVKSTWTSSRGTYAWMGHNGAFTTAPSNILQHWQPLTEAQQSPGLAPTFYANPGVWNLSAHHSEMCVYVQKAPQSQQSFSLTFRHDVHIQHSFLDGQIVPDVKQCLTLFRVQVFTHACFKQSISLLGSNILFGVHPLTAFGQQHILTLCFLPVGHVHRCQLEGVGLCFFIKAITLHSQRLTNEDLSPLCHTSYHSFQERLYCIFVMSHWHLVQCISSHID